MCKILTVSLQLPTVCKSCSSTQIMQEIALFSGKIYIAASRDGRDKSQLWDQPLTWLKKIQIQLHKYEYISTRPTTTLAEAPATILDVHTN